VDQEPEAGLVLGLVPLALGLVLPVVLSIDPHVPDRDCQDVIELGDIAEDFDGVEPASMAKSFTLTPRERTCPTSDLTISTLLTPSRT
jgi:hypothetical protein